jgi:hypothetical protein
LTSFSSAAFDIADILYIFSKPATLTRRSIVPSFLFQLVFLGKFAPQKSFMTSASSSGANPIKLFMAVNLRIFIMS